MKKILKNNAALAKYYEHYYLKDHRAYFAQKTAIKEVKFLLKQHPSCVSSVCDVGCGDGRHLLIFQKCGVESGFGFDNSSQLVVIARKRLKPFPSFQIKKLTFEQWRPKTNQYDLVYSLFSSFGHCLKNSAAQSLVKKMVKAVKPTGIICLDIDNIYRLLRVVSGIERKRNKIKEILTFDRNKKILFSREIRGREILETKTRYFNRHEIATLFKNSGIKPENISFWGGFEGEAYSQKSPRLIAVIKK